MRLKDPSSGSTHLTTLFSSLLFLFLLDALALWLITHFAALAYYPLVAAIGITILLINGIFLVKRAYPIRWMAIGLFFMALFAIYPIIFTGWVAFTNYGDGHLLTKELAVQQILKTKYLPEAGKAYQWAAYQNDQGEYALWLTDEQGQHWIAETSQPILAYQEGMQDVGALNAQGIPTNIGTFQPLNIFQAVSDPNLTEVQFGAVGKSIQIRSPSEAAELLPLYQYDAERDAMIDQRNGDQYYNRLGTFSTVDGKSLRPGFIAKVGWTNFSNFFKSSALSGPLTEIISWNFAFATLSVLMTFALGLAIAIMFNDPDFPGKKLIRSFLLIPYTIPSLITILIWRGMMNPELGVINRTLETWFGWAPPWFTDQWWARIAILLINLWLGYPYFMLICSGALQAIPQEIYAAAEVDGASPWQKFKNITLPLLLVAVGPLMVASFTFNFNNFNLIYLFIGGGPPIAGSTAQAGHTDILISYVYNLAFAGGRGVNYGFAAAITLIIFLIVGAITLFQFRYTRMWEEVSENV